MGYYRRRSKLPRKDGWTEDLYNKALDLGTTAWALTHSLERGSVEQLFGGITKSHTRALAGTESSSRLRSMKATHSLDQLLPQEASGLLNNRKHPLAYT